VVGEEIGHHGDKLFTQRVIERIGPVDGAKNMRCQTNLHRSLSHPFFDVLNKIFTGANIFIIFTGRNFVWENFFQEVVEFLWAL